MLVLDLFQLWRQFVDSALPAVHARSKQRLGYCSLRLVEQHSDQNAAYADGPAGARIDAIQPDHAKARAAPVSGRHGETR